MWGVWDLQVRHFVSWNEKAAWKTKELAEKNKQELERAYPGVKFEVREWLTENF